MSLDTIADEIGSMAKDEAKKVTSAAKKDAKAIQKEAQGQVVEAVSSAKFKGRSDMLKALVAEAKETGTEGMSLRPVSKDRKALEQAAKSIDFGDDIDGIGGFVLESKDGAVVIDYRF